MATYADWAASRQSSAAGYSTATSASNGSAPVKLIIDAHGNVVQDLSSSSSSQVLEASMMEEAIMSVDDQQEIVHNIRQRQRDSDGSMTHDGAAHYIPATISEEQRMWSIMAIPSSTILLVIDTNWLLSHLKLFIQVDQLIPRNDTAFAPVLFILPSIVLKELDGLKHAPVQSDAAPPNLSRHTPAIAHLARTASTFILDKLTHRPDLFRGQKATEGGTNDVQQADKTNDARVLECCTYFQQQGYQVGLLSDDKILSSQATVAGLPYINYTPEDRNPEVFLSKLHPDLPPYFEKLRSSRNENTGIAAASDSAPELTLEAFADKSVQMQQNLLDQQISAVAHLEHNFPLMPPELMEIISVVSNSLLAPVIFPILLHHMANDNLEIFAYMLRRSSIFRDFPFSDSSSKDEEVLDCTRWNAATCLRLIDQNWQLCFADKAGKTLSSASNGSGSSNGASSSAVISRERAKAFSSTTKPSTGNTLSQSRWASSSSSSSFSPRRNFSSSSSDSASNANPTFHPSKVSALAKAFASSDEDILRWSSARWRLVLEDLEVLLCRTAILADVPDGKQKAQLLLDAARKNVDSWKVS